MMDQVKVNSITTFGICCINNTIGICRDASEEYFEIVKRTKRENREDSRDTHVVPILAKVFRRKN